jgi:hypothetical protein
MRLEARNERLPDRPEPVPVLVWPACSAARCALASLPLWVCIVVGVIGFFVALLAMGMANAASHQPRTRK